MLDVEFGIGEAHPGSPHSSRKVSTERECFTPQIRRLFTEAQAIASSGTDAQFVWLTIKNSDGESLFEVESQLMEWLDP